MSFNESSSLLGLGGFDCGPGGAINLAVRSLVGAHLEVVALLALELLRGIGPGVGLLDLDGLGAGELLLALSVLDLEAGRVCLVLVPAEFDLLLFTRELKARNLLDHDGINVRLGIEILHGNLNDLSVARVGTLVKRHACIDVDRNRTAGTCRHRVALERGCVAGADDGDIRDLNMNVLSVVPVIRNVVGDV